MRFAREAIETAIGGVYEMSDGRAFWINGPVAREIVRRISATVAVTGTDAVREALLSNRCPDCGNYGFILGPRGGSARNIFCADPECRAGFNIAPQAVFVQRIGPGGPQFYPPKVHVLHHGLPLCRFSLDVPAEWALGHCWVGLEEIDAMTCPVCEATARTARPLP